MSEQSRSRFAAVPTASMEAAEELDTLQQIAHTLLDRQALLCEGLPWKDLPCTQRLLDTHHKVVSGPARGADGRRPSLTNRPCCSWRAT